MRSGLFLPLFDPLADPAVVARLAGEAEEAGWDGFFVWDQIRWREPVAAVGDTQVTLAAIAAATERIRLGPLVTPLARRRPVKVARETAALDLLSRGRLTLGVGLGADHFAREYSMTGEGPRTLLESGLSPAEVMDLIPVNPLAEDEPAIKQAYQTRLPALFAKIKP